LRIRKIWLGGAPIAQREKSRNHRKIARDNEPAGRPGGLERGLLKGPRRMSVTSDEWQVIEGQAHRRRHPPMWLRWVTGGLCVLVGALVWNQRPRASSLPADATGGGAAAAVVVEGGRLRVQDRAAAAEIFDLAAAEEIRPSLEPDDDLLRPGDPGDWLVPSVAVVTRRGRPFVLVARSDGHIDPLAVDVVVTREGKSQISGALAAGDRVVAGGAIYLLNMLVLQGGL
jgi:hypothetical protein